MGRHRLLLALFALLALFPSRAAAVITTDVVVIVGAEVAPATGQKLVDKERDLEKSGLRLWVSPSIVRGEAKPQFHYYVGRSIASLPLTFESAPGTAVPLPSAETIAVVTQALRARGILDPVQLVVVVHASGGK